MNSHPSNHRDINAIRILTVAMTVTTAVVIVAGTGVLVCALIIARNSTAWGLFALLLVIMAAAHRWFGPGSGRRIAAFLAVDYVLTTVVIAGWAPWMPLAVWDLAHAPAVHEKTTCEDGTLHRRTWVEGTNGDNGYGSVENIGQDC